MEDNQLIDSEQPFTHKFYNSFHIGLGTFLGGSVIGGYLLYANFKKLGNTKAAHASLIGGIVFFALLVYLLVSAPFLENVPNVLYVVVQVGIFSWIYQEKQKEAIDELQKQHGKGIYFAWWRTALISLTVLVPAFLGGFLIAEMSQPDYPEHMKDPTVYKFQNAQIIYDAADLTKNDAIRLAEILIKLGSVSPNDPISIFYDKVDGIMTVGMIINPQFRNDAQVNAFWDEWQALLSAQFESGAAVELYEDGYTEVPYRVIR